MIAIYELRNQDDVIGETNRNDAQIVTDFMKDDNVYFNGDNSKSLGSLKPFAGSVMNYEDIGIFANDKLEVLISVCCDKETRRPARIQFIGLEGEILSVKNVLGEKLNTIGYRLS